MRVPEARLTHGRRRPCATAPPLPGERRNRLWIRLCAAAMLCMGGWQAARAAPPHGHPVEAEFLYQFSQFTEWPPDTFSDPAAAFTICVLGNDPFGASLAQAVQGQSMGHRRFVIRHYEPGQRPMGCQILFTGANGLSRLATLQPALRRNHVLTVSDAADAVHQGAIIQFVTRQAQIRLRINIQAARAAGLTISSKLLRRAEIVGRPPQE